MWEFILHIISNKIRVNKMRYCIVCYLLLHYYEESTVEWNSFICCVFSILLHTYCWGNIISCTFFILSESLVITYSRSSGPGGQNVNVVNTKVDVRFHVESAEWLSKELRTKILDKVIKITIWYLYQSLCSWTIKIIFSTCFKLEIIYCR